MLAYNSIIILLIVSNIMRAIEFSIADRSINVVGNSNTITRIPLSLKNRNSFNVASLFRPNRSSSVTISTSPLSRISSFNIIDLTKLFSDGKGDFSKVEFLVQNKTDNCYVQAKLNQDEGVYYVTGHTPNKADATHFVPVKTGDTKGRILIKGLEDDTYTMTEVRTDNGYVLLKQDIEVVISQKESTESCTIYASDALGLIQNDPRYAKVIQSDADLKNIPQKHLEHKLLTASATVSGKNVNMAEDNGSANAEVPLTVVNSRGFDLPKTGDNGTMMFTIVGILLMVGAAAVLYAVSNKKSA